MILFAIAAAGSVGACSHNHDVYDASGNRHAWNNREDAAYRRWEQERRMTHAEYSRRAAEEQRQYWEWRRNHQ
jgi:hypothetical protein